MILRFEGVAARRGGRWLFGPISLALSGGGAALVTGPNGVGKSSLLRIAAGLLAPAAGQVEVHSPRALMADRAALDGERSLQDALGFWAGLDGTRDRLAEALAALDLTSIADVPVRLLSTGQRRRGVMAGVMASGAALWLLDEPASGLDAASVVGVEAAVAAHRAKGGAVIVTTHQPFALPGAQLLTLGDRA